MTGFSYFLIFAFFTLIWTFTRGDLEVYCQFSSTCILPCSFPTGDEVVLHWIQVLPEKKQAHSYYHNKDQLGLQDKVFKGRTSLYNDHISNGNASLRLRDIKVRDEGRYQCYTSTIKGNKETFIQLKVYAPVEEVTIRKLEEDITCSSDGIYPRPTLTWTINSQLDQQKEPSISETELQLYKISSSLPLPSHHTDVDFSCTISTDKSQKRTTLFKEAHKNSLDRETTVECQALGAPIKSVIWRFNHSQVILTWDETESSYSATEEWRKHVKEVSERGTLTLKDLTSNQEGTYTCESRNANETGISSTVLHITTDGNTETASIAIGATVAVILLLVIVIVVVIIWRRRHKTHRSARQTNSDEERSLSLKKNPTS